MWQYQHSDIKGPPERVGIPAIDTARTPDPSVNEAGLMAGYYPVMAMNNRGYMHPCHVVVGMPSARERKLALQTFDGEELYYVTGNGFIEWG